MHDHTLRRTTDVEKVFRGREMDDVSLFNWTDLQQLNAGQWFLQVAISIIIAPRDSDALYCF